ncbi:MAG: TIGR02757 family protein [Bacteroidetes bacterium]|nr:MAG: TIGR02757 family protein [Bacteroidota bacterium]
MSDAPVALSREALQQILDDSHDRYNRPGFIEEDPISIPHMFSRREDIEIAGFLTALIAWGRRSSILASAHRLVRAMDMAPYEFVCHGSEEDWARLAGFVHRTFNGQDALALIKALRRVYATYGTLEGIFAEGLPPGSPDVGVAIVHAREVLASDPDFPARTHKHLANPARGSSAKRINMFLRWMVRKDARGVDFGLWSRIQPAQLICPLDVHTGNVARALGLLTRKQNDWKAAQTLTGCLRAFCPEDPVRYDFSLFGLGVYGHL